METPSGRRRGLEGTVATDGVPEQKRSPISGDPKQGRGEEAAGRIRRHKEDFVIFCMIFLYFLDLP